MAICDPQQVANDSDLSGAVDTLEGKDVTQRELDRLKRWSHVYNMQFNKAKCKVVHLGWDSPKHKYRLGDEGIESCPGEKELAGS